MNHEFITSKGKIVLNDKRLIIENMKFNFWQTAVGEMLLPVSTIVLIIFSFLNPGRPFSYFMTAILVILFCSTSLKQVYSILFQKSYSTYIPLNAIVSFQLKPDQFGLETAVVLHLKNGRFRSIQFRTLEKQYEPFADILSQLIHQTKLA